MVVGFEVMACSIARVAGEAPKDVSCIDTLEGRPPQPQEITKGMGRGGVTPATVHVALLPAVHCSALMYCWGRPAPSDF